MPATGAHAPVARDQTAGRAVCLVGGRRADGPTIFAIYVWYRTRLSYFGEFPWLYLIER